MKKVMLKTQQSGLKCRIIKKRGKYLIQYYGQGESPVGFDPWGKDQWFKWRTLTGCNWIGNPSGEKIPGMDLDYLVKPCNSFDQAVLILEKWKKGYAHRMNLAFDTKQYGYIWQRCPEG